MFCANCGKELKDSDKFCNVCGRMVTSNTSDNQNTTYVDAVPVNSSKNEKLWSKKTILGITIGAGAVIILCLIITLISAGISKFSKNNNSFEHHREYGNGGNPGSYDIYGGYGNQGGGYNYGYGYPGGNSNDSSSGYGRYGNGNSGSSDNSSNSVSDPLPTDKNGNSASNPNYEWPSGDGTYEFYTKSTIPKFESVTGEACTATETDSNGNTYYKYSMNMDAYNKYIKVIEEAGYSQSEFDVQGRNSFVRYENGNQYLDIYLMNSDNEIVIMA